MNIVAENIQRWDELFATQGWGRYPPEELVRFAARTFSKSGRNINPRVLEVGCGPGANIWYLAREGFEVAGIDGSAQAIATARNRLIEERMESAAALADLRVGNFATLPWGNESFDFVVDIEAVYANPIETIRSVFQEIFRVLKPGGVFFSKMFGPKTTGITSGDLIETGTTSNPIAGPLRGTGISHAFTREEILRELSPFSEINVEWSARSALGGTMQIFEWVVSARK